MLTLDSSTTVSNYFLDLGIVKAGEAVVRDGDGWLYFASPREIATAKQIDDVACVLSRAERHINAGGWAVGFVAYDAGPAFDTAIKSQRGDQPLAWFALFDEPPARF